MKCYVNDTTKLSMSFVASDENIAYLWILSCTVLVALAWRWLYAVISIIDASSSVCCLCPFNLVELYGDLQCQWIYDLLRITLLAKLCLGNQKFMKLIWTCKQICAKFLSVFIVDLPWNRVHLVLETTRGSHLVLVWLRKRRYVHKDGTSHPVGRMLHQRSLSIQMAAQDLG